MQSLSGRAVEEVVAERHDPQQTVLDAAVQVAILTTDPAGIVTLFNAGAERMLGYHSSEVVGRLNIETFHLADELDSYRQELLSWPSSRGDRACVLLEKARRGRPDEREWTWVTKSGQPLSVSLSISAIRHPDGLLSGFLMVARDVTAARFAEQALRDSEERVRAIVSAASDAILTVDVRGLIDSFNPAAEQLFGYPAHEVLGRNVSLLLPASLDQDHEPDSLPLLLQGGSGTIGPGRQMLARRRDNSVFPAELTVGEVRLGSRLLFTAVIRDVTLRNEAEAQLQKAKESAEAASRLKSEFLANMSHEIRTPLNGILGMTELTLGTELTSEQREYLEIVHSSGQSLLTLLNDILDFSKIEAGKLDLEQIGFPLRETVHRVIRNLGHRARSKNLRLRCDIADDVPDHLVGDPGRLSQVLINLVGNAIKFTEKGEVAVRIRADDRSVASYAEEGNELPANEPRPSTFIIFEVRDTGIGIAAEKLEYIFEPFEQADTSTTRKFGGTGLGLAISARLVCLMGGQIGVRSTPGIGSTFLFSAPFAVQPGPYIPLAPTPASPSDHGRSWSSRRILVVEDNQVNQLLVQRLLARKGVQVALASNGREALAVLQSEPVDLILMDVQMPEMDGIEATQAIRCLEHGTSRRVPILALTAHAMKGDRERCLEAGMDGYLAKPVQAHELYATIEHALEGTPVEGPAEPPRAVFDRAALLARVGGDEALLRDLVRLFVEECPERLAAIRGAVEAQDAVALHRTAHHFKGALGLFGMPEANEAVRRLEGLARAGELGAARATFATLEEHTNHLLASLAGVH